MYTKKHFLALSLAVLVGGAAHADDVVDNVIIGSDLNSAENPFIQPTDPALSGGGRDQTMQFGDLLPGTQWDDVIIGRLGTDVIYGGQGDDIMIGGTEHFNPNNRDRAIGGHGSDMFMWAPGDGSDTFLGGPGNDIVALGLIAEVVDGEIVFQVFDDQLAGDVYLNPASDLPLQDVTNSPGFCEFIDESTSADAADELAALNVDDLIRFVIRSARDDFEAGVQDVDNGLRVTLHLKGVEFVVCASREGGEIRYYDLSANPPAEVDILDLPAGVRARLLATII